MKIIEIISNIKNIVCEATIKHFAHLGLDQNNQEHRDLIAAYNLGVNNDPNIPKHPQQIKTIDQLKTAVSEYLEKIHEKRSQEEDDAAAFANGEAKLVYDNPTTGIKIYKVSSGSGCSAVAGDTIWCVSNRISGQDMFHGYDKSGLHSYVIYTPEKGNLSKIGIIGIKPFEKVKGEEQFVDKGNNSISDSTWEMLRKKYNFDSIDILGGIRDISPSDSRAKELEIEKSKDPEFLYMYTLTHNKIRHNEAEKYIMKSPWWAYEYAKNIIGERWPEAEPYIIKNANAAYSYNYNVINFGKKNKDRWPEAERYIMKSPRFAYYYARYIIGERWPEAEKYIILDLPIASEYASDVIKSRWPEFEYKIVKDPEAAFFYTRDVINKNKGDNDKKIRWSEAEQYIIKSPEWAYNYADQILQHEWPEAEPIIMRDPCWAFFYARDVLQRRWYEAEPFINKDPEFADRYHEDVVLPAENNGD